MHEYKPCLDCGKQIYMSDDDPHQRCLKCHENFKKESGLLAKKFQTLSKPMKQALGYVEQFLNSPTQEQLKDLAIYYGCSYPELTEVINLRRFANQVNTEKVVPYDIISRDKRRRKKQQ